MKSCAVCPVSFTPRGGKGPTQIYCSIACRKRQAYLLAKARGRDSYSYPGWTEARRASYQRREAIKKGASTAEAIIPALIYARDSWICGLCAEVVDPTLVYPHPFSVSLDHIVPLSLGGLHDPSNLQCAHLRCNHRKGNRVELNQLALAER